MYSMVSTLDQWPFSPTLGNAAPPSCLLAYSQLLANIVARGAQISVCSSRCIIGSTRGSSDNSGLWGGGGIVPPQVVGRGQWCRGFGTCVVGGGQKPYVVLF